MRTLRKKLLTGALPSPPDKKDFQLGKIQAPIELPEYYLPDYSSLEVLHQSGQPACGGHAGARAKAVLDFLETNQVKYYSPRFIYACCKAIDGIFDTDGTFLRAIGDALRKWGACDTNLFPNDTHLSKEQYKDFALISEDAFDNAQSRIIKSYAFTGTSLEAIKQGIYQNKAVVLLISPFFEGYPDGHFVVADGFNKNEIRYINSFGLEWGNRGYGWFKEGTHQKILEGMTMIDLPDGYVEMLKSQITLLKKLAELLLKLKSLLKV